MKEIETGKQLRRVETNDRSRPILPKTKAKGKVLSGQTTFMPTDDTTIDGDPLKEVVISITSSSISILINVSHSHHNSLRDILKAISRMPAINNAAQQQTKTNKEYWLYRFVT